MTDMKEQHTKSYC